jgi:hypothetical protein
MNQPRIVSALVVVSLIVVLAASFAFASEHYLGTMDNRSGKSLELHYTQTSLTGDLTGVDKIAVTIASMTGVAPGTEVLALYGDGEHLGGYDPDNATIMTWQATSCLFVNGELGLAGDLPAPASHVDLAQVFNSGGALAHGLWTPAGYDVLPCRTFEGAWAGDFFSGKGVGVGDTLAELYLPTGNNFMPIMLRGVVELSDGSKLSGIPGMPLTPVGVAPGGPYRVEPGGSVLLDGSDSFGVGQILSYKWSVADGGGRIEASSPYTSLSYEYLTETLGWAPGHHSLWLGVTADLGQSNPDHYYTGFSGYTVDLFIVPEPCTLLLGAASLIVLTLLHFAWHPRENTRIEPPR